MTSESSDFRRLGRWLVVVGTVALVLALLVVLAMLFLGSHSVADEP